MVRFIGALLVAIVAALVVFIWMSPGIHADQGLAAAAAQARGEAKKWQTNAALVQIELTGFGFASRPSGIPDMTHAGPPRLAMFSFISPSIPRGILRVSVRINEPPLPAAQQQARNAMGYKTVMVDVLPSAPPSKLPLPANVESTFPQALARASEDLGKDCARGDPKMSSCTLVQTAALHMYPRDQADTVGRPAWTIRFGQHPRFRDTVSRVVDATSMNVVARNIDSRSPTGIIPGLGARVTAVRFFVSSGTLPPAAERKYDDLFFYNAARFIHWEMQVVHPAPGQPRQLTVTDMWAHMRGLGEILHRDTRTVTVEPHWTQSWVTGSANLMGSKTVQNSNPLYDPTECGRRRREFNPIFGNDYAVCQQTVPVEIYFWSTGVYEVKLLVDQRLVASGTFSMRDKNDVYGEVAARARDRSAPSGTIPALEARVASLRFFESGDVQPPVTSQRRYASSFPQAGTRNVFWQIDLKHEAADRWLPVTFEAPLFFTEAGRERVIQRKVLQAAAPGDWSNTSYADWFGWSNDYYWDRAGSTTPSPRRWLPGTYRVDLHVDGTKVASGSFEVR